LIPVNYNQKASLKDYLNKPQTNNIPINSKYKQINQNSFKFINALKSVFVPFYLKFIITGIEDMSD
jgi:hypothetical protein